MWCPSECTSKKSKIAEESLKIGVQQRNKTSNKDAFQNWCAKTKIQFLGNANFARRLCVELPQQDFHQSCKTIFAPYEAPVVGQYLFINVGYH